MPQLQISPEQVPQLIAQNKAELAAVSEMLAIKSSILEKLRAAKELIESGDTTAAFLVYVEIQTIEYSVLVRAFSEKKSAIENFLAQLESPIQRVDHLPPPNRGGFKAPRQ